MKKFTKTSSQKEIEGVWTDYEGSSLLIARSDGANQNYDNVLQRLMKPYKSKMERGKSVSNEVAKKVMTRVTAEAILLDWNKEGHDGEMILDDDDSPAEYSIKNATELLTKDKDMRKFVDDFAGDIDNFLNEVEIAKK